MSKSLFSTEQKLTILQEIENGQLGIMAVDCTPSSRQ